MMMPVPPLGPRSLDSETPNAARMYDYYLGGAHNFGPDRDLAERARMVLPCVDALARLSRSWLRRVVIACLDAGIDQFLDLGSGIPTVGNVHEIVQERSPDGRVVYVDYEPVAYYDALKMLQGNDNATILQADIRDPDSVLRSPEVAGLLDFSRPIGMLLAGVLLYVGDEHDPAGLVAAYRQPCAPGSHLALSIITLDEVDPITHGQVLDLVNVYENANDQLHVRGRDHFTSWFAGTTLLEPGVVPLPDWRPDNVLDGVDADNPARLLGYGGVGRIPN
ncbi:MAG: SAM-dependent methyltransferase [Sciscionella sp.]